MAESFAVFRKSWKHVYQLLLAYTHFPLSRIESGLQNMTETIYIVPGEQNDLLICF